VPDEGVGVFQREIARLVLEAIGTDGFALAGSLAVQVHGILERPTQDIDLFTAPITAAQFSAAVDQAVAALQDAGLTVRRVRTAQQFARLIVVDVAGRSTDVDLGVDWRAHEPTPMSVGPVLDIRDACANKVLAVYSRGEVRDFIDLDAIRVSGPFDDAELLALAAEHDPGFDRAVFAQQLAAGVALSAHDYSRYGLGADASTSIKNRLADWADTLVPQVPQRGASTYPSSPRGGAPSPHGGRWAGPDEQVRPSL